MFKPDEAFRLTHKIHPYIQDSIIENVINYGYTPKSQPFWTKYDIRTIVPGSIDGTYSGNDVPISFNYRLDPRAEWNWEENNEAATLVKSLLEPVEHLFTKLTRVAAFVQTPGMRIGAHRDLIPGNSYKHIQSPYSQKFGGYSGVYRGDPNLIVENNTRHPDQRYLNLKIPISSDPNNSGEPYIHNGKDKLYLKSNDCYYFINEYEIMHGCDPVNFYRGVIFIDGIINMDVLEQEPKLDFSP